MSPDCFVTSVESPSTDIVVNPPDSKWKAETMEYLERWAGTTLQCKEERMVIKTEIDSISPHLVDAIEGDGHCFFRAISKGTQTYHASFRKAVVEWMLCEDHPPRLAKYVAPHDNMVTGSDYQLAIQKYIDQGRMSQDGWGGDKEIIAFATMLTFVCQQTPVEGDDGMFTTHISGMKRTVGGNPTTGLHYDLVIPSKK